MAYDQTKVTINSVLEANFAGGNGGGLASTKESTILLENGAKFQKNSAVGNGGGILASGVSTTIGDLKSLPLYLHFFLVVGVECLFVMRSCGILYVA